jgi:hypothetical protein
MPTLRFANHVHYISNQITSSLNRRNIKEREWNLVITSRLFGATSNKSTALYLSLSSVQGRKLHRPSAADCLQTSFYLGWCYGDSADRVNNLSEAHDRNTGVQTVEVIRFESCLFFIHLLSRSVADTSTSCKMKMSSKFFSAQSSPPESDRVTVFCVGERCTILVYTSGTHSRYFLDWLAHEHPTSYPLFQRWRLILGYILVSVPAFNAQNL